MCSFVKKRFTCYVYISAAGTSWDGVVPIIQVSSVTANGYTELRAFLGRLAPPEPLEAMYKEARGKAAEVNSPRARRDGEALMLLGKGTFTRIVKIFHENNEVWMLSVQERLYGG